MTYFDEDLLPVDHWNEARIRTVLTPNENLLLDLVDNWRDRDRITETATYWLLTAFQWSSTPEHSWHDTYTRLQKLGEQT